jgi:sulfotransferase 6B1
MRPAPIFLNTIPKSGTNLAIQLFYGMPGVASSPQPPFYEGLSRDFAEDHDRLASLVSGDLVAGHVYYSPLWVELLNNLGISRYFLYRDPRDVVVSHMHFAMASPWHMHHAHLSQCLHRPQDRLRALITGFVHEPYEVPDIGAWCRLFLPWRNEEGVLAISFEDLVRSPNSRRQTCKRMVRHLFGMELGDDQVEAIIAAMQASADAGTSPTFRQSKIGAWREEFDATTKKVFKAEAGDLLIEMGYEAGDDW